jgi:hypothetical protein
MQLPHVYHQLPYDWNMNILVQTCGKPPTYFGPLPPPPGRQWTKEITIMASQTNGVQ